MRCFRTTRQFARQFLLEQGRWRPQSSWYLVEYQDGRYERLLHAPKSYRKVKKVVYCLDDEAFVERILDVWVEQPSPRGRRWLVEREARRVLDALASRQDLGDDLDVPYNVDAEVRQKLWGYLRNAKKAHRREFDRKVLETARESMAEAGEFSLLNCCGDSLENPPRW